MGNHTTLFSIVVPVYNVDIYLKDCIESVLNQSFTDFELILVDDGSTDSSPSICDQYQKNDRRIKVIHKDNGGLVSARKAGVSIAKGEYVVCLDSDDWIDKNHLLELSKVIKNYSPDIICFNYYEVNENGDVAKRANSFEKGLYLKKDLEDKIYPYLIQTKLGSSFPPTIWSKAYKRDLYLKEQMEVDNQIKIGEDVACTIPCMVNAGSVYILDKYLYYYRRNNISMTKNKKAFSWKGPELIDLHLKRRIKMNDKEFQKQISRRTIHALINVVKTQFYRKEKYSSLKSEIKEKISQPIYSQALIESDFKKGSNISICRFLLLHNMYFPFYLLSKVK